jgi:hypothetical protein
LSGYRSYVDVEAEQREQLNLSQQWKQCTDREQAKLERFWKQVKQLADDAVQSAAEEKQMKEQQTENKKESSD